MYPALRLPSQGKPVIRDDGTIKSVPGVMNYVQETTSVAHIRRDQSGTDDGVEGAVWMPQELQVENGRTTDKEYSLHQSGFELGLNPVRGMSIDFLDTQDVLDRYYPHCESILRQKLGEDVLVKAFDHNLRMTPGTEQTMKNADGSKVQNPLGLVHGDYTAVSAPRRILDLAQPPKANDMLRLRLGTEASSASSLLDSAMAEQAATHQQRRYAIVNVWRNLDLETPVKSSPLACLDARTVKRSNFRTLQIHYADRVGENYLCCPASSDQEHRWVYFPEMNHDEALLIKTWDSAGDIAQGKDVDTVCSTLAIHSAFLAPPVTTEEDAPPRKSIEVRCVCIWPNNK